jgi:hypothetical protein
MSTEDSVDGPQSSVFGREGTKSRICHPDRVGVDAVTERIVGRRGMGRIVAGGRGLQVKVEECEECGGVGGCTQGIFRRVCKQGTYFVKSEKE